MTHLSLQQRISNISSLFFLDSAKQLRNRYTKENSFGIPFPMKNNITHMLACLALNALIFSCAATPHITFFTQPPNHCIPNHMGHSHAAVTHSLCRGLTELGIPFNINPQSSHALASIVMVLGDPEALKQCIILKRLKKIKTLIVGPNVLASGDSEKNILAAPEIDYALQPSPWAVQGCLDTNPYLSAHKMYAWPAGVNAQVWSPSAEQHKKKYVLVYRKTELECFCNTIEKILHAQGYTTRRITYGSYSPEQYLHLLNGAQFAVFISRSESQGLALAEAWAMDVPTLVWDPGELYYMGRFYNPVSSCPYLSTATGMAFKGLKDFESALIEFAQKICTFSPRIWVLENMTDRHCAQHLLQIIAGDAPSYADIKK